MRDECLSLKFIRTATLSTYHGLVVVVVVVVIVVDLMGPCGSSAIPPITIHSLAVIT